MHKEGFERLELNNTIECLYPYILKILSEKPAHAYVLREGIQKRFGFKVGPVTCYKVLYLLKKEGLVERTQKDRIKIYKLTDKGKKELEKVVGFYKERIMLLQSKPV